MFGKKKVEPTSEEARNMFDIKEGDTLMVLGDKEKGLALVKADIFYSLMGNK